MSAHRWRHPALGELAHLVERGDFEPATVRVMAIDLVAGELAASAANAELGGVEDWLAEGGDDG